MHVRHEGMQGTQGTRARKARNLAHSFLHTGFMVDVIRGPFYVKLEGVMSILRTLTLGVQMKKKTCELTCHLKFLKFSRNSDVLSFLPEIK